MAGTLHEAIGYVCNEAAGISMALEQVFCALLGNDRAWASQQDASLGSQASAVLTTAQQPFDSHPMVRDLRVDEEVRDWIVAELKTVQWAAQKRNRVVHDFWSMDSHSETRVVGIRAARFKIADVVTTTPALIELGRLFGELHMALQDEAVFISMARNGEPPAFSQTTPDRESVRRLHETAQEHWNNMKTGSNTDWVWTVEQR
ncbi:hypothetical protein ACQBAR_07285 [Propionibacteriaceae bacterium Y1685]